MIILLQRVSMATVEVAGTTRASINQGLLAFIAIEPADDLSICERMAKRIVNYRVFSDVQGNMNRSLSDIAGEVLAVPQFTLAADTGKGLRPSFSSAAAPAMAERYFDTLVASLKQFHLKVQSGQFGADMKVQLINDGPATFLLKS